MHTKISPAIILRTRESGETDLIVSFFTRDEGRLKGLAKGARRSKKRFVNCLDTFSLVDLEYGPKKRGRLYFLHSGRLKQAYPGLRCHFDLLTRASYLVEVTEILFPWGMAEPGMFDLLKDSFELLDRGEMVDRITMAFEIKAMVLGGYGMNFERCCICGRPYRGEGRAVSKGEKGGIACLRCEQESSQCPGLDPETVQAIQAIRLQPLSRIKDLPLSDRVLKEIKPALKIHREYHLGKMPKTAHYLE